MRSQFRHSRMLLAGIQANRTGPPIEAFGGDDLDNGVDFNIRHNKFTIMLFESGSPNPTLGRS